MDRPTPPPDGATILKIGVTRTLQSGDYSDFTIICSGWEFKVHKVIVCTQSDWFKNVCKKGFAEGNSGTASLPDDKIDGVKALVRYMYEFDYSIPDPSNESALKLHTHIHTIADKYQCLGLKKVAAQKFAEVARVHWWSPRFVEAIKLIYSAPSLSNRDLRDVVVSTSLERAERLIHYHDLHKSQHENSIAFTAMLEEEGEFSKDLIFAMPRYKRHAVETLGPNNAMMVELECQYCSGVWRMPKIDTDYHSIRKDCPSCQEPNTQIHCKPNRSPKWVEPKDFTRLYCHHCEWPFYYLGHDVMTYDRKP